MQSRRAAGLAFVVIVMTSLALVLPTRAASGPPACDTGAVTGDGSWQAIATPDFPLAAGNLRHDSYSVEPADPAFLFMSDGYSILASGDGGCTWGVSLGQDTASQLASDGSDPQIWSLATADRARSYAVVVARGSATQVRVFATGDGGATWFAGAGLSAFSDAAVVGAAPSAAATAYIAVKSDRVYATSDGGRSWVAGASLGTTAPIGVVVDEQDTRRLWVWSHDGLRTSTDGGLTLGAAVLSAPIDALDVAHAAGQPLLLTAFLADGKVRRSADAGAHWSDRPKVEANAAVHSRENPDWQVVTNGPATMQAAADNGTWLDISPHLSTTFTDAQATRTAPTYVYVRTGDGLERTVIARRDGDARHAVAPSELRPPGPPRFDPPVGEVRVTPGTPRRVDEVLRMPPLVAVDLMFLVDTTSSMNSLIDGLRGGMSRLVSTLQAAQVDLRVGVAEVRDYPFGGYGYGFDEPYRRLRDLAPVDNRLRDVLASLTPDGGGDVPEAQLAALFQVASGAGQGPKGSATYIPPGQAASYRPGVVRVAVMGTDSPFHRPDYDPKYPGPTMAQAVDALRAKGIRVIGLYVDRPAVPDLQEVARGTGAIATADVDCDDDGVADVRAGDPIVCAVSPKGKNLAAAVVSQLGAIDASGTVAISVSDPNHVVASVGPVSFGPRRLGVANALPFHVTYTCTKEQTGGRYPVGLVATVDGRPILQGVTTVACGATAAAAAAAAPPRAQPQSPPANPAPAQAPAVQVAPAPNLVPQAMVQPGHEEEARLAELGFVAALLVGATAVGLTTRSRADLAFIPSTISRRN
jgi:hypothetical protein